MTWRPTSLRGRVTLSVLGLLLVVLAVLFTLVDLALSSRLHAEARTRLTDRVALAQQLDGSLSPQQLVDRLRGDGVTAQLCTPDDGSCVVADPAPAPPAPAGPAPRPPAKAVAAPVVAAGPVLFVSTTLQGGARLTLSTDTTQISSALSRLVLLEVVGGAGALVATGLLLSRVARVALRPLDDMTALARQIAGGDRGRRLRVPGSDSELARTAAAFDSMLDELEQAAATAEGAETRMREFLGDASHELRTPLAALQAGAEELLRADPDRADREQIAVAMVRQTQRAARLVEDLLTVARLDAPDELALRTEPVDLVALAAAEVRRAQALAPDLVLSLDAGRAVPVTGDPVRLGQVLTNLLDNARHATPPGGRITVGVHEQGGTAEVCVRDTGPGVPPAERERVFARFARLDASRSRHTGGAGLGLPIARGLARAHGGELVSADCPDGACFRLTLPSR